MSTLTIRRTAVVSSCGLYRYALRREFGAPPSPRVLFVMLNPSTADHAIDDPTIRKLVGFAVRWGCLAVDVVNLFAFRATSPAEMKRAWRKRDVDIVGPENDGHIDHNVRNASRVIVAWGRGGTLFGRDREVLARIRAAGFTPEALGVNGDGTPEHPLYVPYEATPRVYDGRR
jgi:hypothetical protein